MSLLYTMAVDTLARIPNVPCRTVPGDARFAGPEVLPAPPLRLRLGHEPRRHVVVHVRLIVAQRCYGSRIYLRPLTPRMLRRVGVSLVQRAQIAVTCGHARFQ